MCSTDLSTPLSRPNLPNTSPFHSRPRYLQPYHRLRLTRTASVFLFLSLYMPTRFADTNPSRSTQVIDIKQTFRTVLGFRSPAGYLSTADANALTRSAHEQFVSKEPPSTERNSIDFSNAGAFRLTLSYKKKHKSRNKRCQRNGRFFLPTRSRSSSPIRRGPGKARLSCDDESARGSSGTCKSVKAGTNGGAGGTLVSQRRGHSVRQE